MVERSCSTQPALGRTPDARRQYITSTLNLSGGGPIAAVERWPERPACEGDVRINRASDRPAISVLGSRGTTGLSGFAE